MLIPDSSTGTGRSTERRRVESASGGRGCEKSADAALRVADDGFPSNWEASPLRGVAIRGVTGPETGTLEEIERGSINESTSSESTKSKSKQGSFDLVAPRAASEVCCGGNSRDDSRGFKGCEAC